MTMHARTRDSGRRQYSATGEEVITAMRNIVKDRSYAVVNGTTVDTFSASAVIAVYDNVSAANKEKLLKMSVVRLVAVCFATLDRAKAH